MNIINGRVVGDGDGDDIDGDVGNIFTSSTGGVVHTGKGDIIFNGETVTGPGAVYISGGHHGGISQTFYTTSAPKKSKKRK
ncbi:hypothetical protein DP939_23380 [Spongiactinospora rosea]|uniref:Uncharacterized protein n=1 Tax=Spongiactinospora rosea TaxID=2248750 RepID=A0A366LWV9_9ACTN|nr:hypothetical protein [Spongiactinospora rosea]RBQ17804.1 hypothetical protein DP939_23380 [Spongiactinospora rosea]